MNLDFTGKVAIVTGAASGIGKATARAYAESGAQVALVDVDKTKGLEVARSIDSSLKNVLFCHTDVSSETETLQMARQVFQTFGRIDILVNNAGIECDTEGNLIEMSSVTLKRIVDVNLFGYINCARSVVPHLQRGGRIVNVSSVQGLGALAPGTSYQVSKAGVLGLTHALAIELSAKGITVNTVAPGAIATEGMGAISAGSDILDSFRKRIPVGRRGRPEEVANAILFLTSEFASYITGVILPVDGGYLVNLSPGYSGNPPILPDDPDR